MRIKVKRKHIKKGLRSSPDSCPIALAIRKSSSSDSSIEVEVYNGSAWIGDDRHKLPKKIKKFIRQFDKGGSRKQKSFCFKLK